MSETNLFNPLWIEHHPTTERRPTRTDRGQINIRTNDLQCRQQFASVPKACIRSIRLLELWTLRPRERKLFLSVVAAVSLRLFSRGLGDVGRGKYGANSSEAHSPSPLLRSGSKNQSIKTVATFRISAEPPFPPQDIPRSGSSSLDFSPGQPGVSPQRIIKP